MRTFLACSNIPHWQHLDASACCRYTWLVVVVVAGWLASWLAGCCCWCLLLLFLLLGSFGCCFARNFVCVAGLVLLAALFSQHFPVRFFNSLQKSFVYLLLFYSHTAPQSAFVVAGAWYMPSVRRSARAYLKDTFHNHVNLSPTLPADLCPVPCA